MRERKYNFFSIGLQLSKGNRASPYFSAKILYLKWLGKRVICEQRPPSGCRNKLSILGNFLLKLDANSF
jgi:hypothetical protein